MSDVQVITTTKDGTKIGDFNIRSSFLDQKVSPYMPKGEKEKSKVDALLKNMSVPFGLVYLQTYGKNPEQTPLDEFENMNINNVSIDSEHDNSNHVVDTKVMEQSLCDRLLGVVKAYEKEKKEKEEKKEKREENKNKNKNKNNNRATRKINKNVNNKNNNKNNKNTRKNKNNIVINK